MRRSPAGEWRRMCHAYAGDALPTKPTKAQEIIQERELIEQDRLTKAQEAIRKYELLKRARIVPPDVATFNCCTQRSEAYRKVLGATPKQTWIAAHEMAHPGGSPVARLQIAGKHFWISIELVCTAPYGDDAGWRPLLMARADDGALNKTTGNGTIEVNIVTGRWHSKIIAALTDGIVDGVAYDIEYDGTRKCVTCTVAEHENDAGTNQVSPEVWRAHVRGVDCATGPRE